MRIRVHRAGEVEAYVRHVRSEVIREMGRGPDSPDTDPLELARYFVACAEDGAPMGLAEAYFHFEYFANPLESPYGRLLDLQRHGPYERICHIRTIFVEPAYRNGGRVFLQLYLAAAYVFHELGALYSTCATAARRDDLRQLYQRLGAEDLGEFFNKFGTVSSGFLFDLRHLLQHSAAAKSIACLEAATLPSPTEHHPAAATWAVTLGA